MDDADVVVIGAGYGGASLAGLLAHAGRRVVLIDKTPRAGGKTQTLDRQGYRYEMFGAVGIPAHGSRFHELVDVLDLHDRVELLVPEGKAAAVRYRAADGTWRHERAPLQQSGAPDELDALRRLYDVDDAGLEAFGNLYLAAVGTDDDGLADLDEVGMLDWMSPFGLPPALQSQVCTTMNTLFCVPVDRLAASEGVLGLRQIATGGAGRFHRNGYGQVAEACAASVVERGGEHRRSQRVERVVVEDGRAIGVRTAHGVVRARAVVSNAGIQPTVLRLAGPEHFPADYVERVRGLEPSWAIAGIRYVLDTEVFEAALTPVYSDQSWLDSARFAAMEAGTWPDVPLIAVDVASHFDPGLVPVPGHQVANIQVFCSPDPDSTMGEEAVRRAEVVLHELWPDLGSHVLRTERFGPRQISRLTRDRAVPGAGGEAVGLAQVVGQVGRHKPDPRTPLPGLYLVGCDAGGRGAGTHQAVDSAFHVAAMVDADLG
ncbi:MAG: NAD(P)/FAD-dependent oxidoreductase [Acidimicrobiales bacterium]